MADLSLDEPGALDALLVRAIERDDGAASVPPLKTEPTAKTEDWGASLSRRIREQVQQDIERSFSEGDAPHASSRFAVAGLVNLVLLVAAIVAIVLLLRLAFCRCIRRRTPMPGAPRSAGRCPTSRATRAM